MRNELRRQDITFETKDQPLRDDVRILGTLVGDLLRDQGGITLFELVETARLRSIRRRENNEQPGEELADLVGMQLLLEAGHQSAYELHLEEYHVRSETGVYDQQAA